MTTCISNMRQIGTAVIMYAGDYDETFPYVTFYSAKGNWGAKGDQTYTWKNAIRPYLKSLDVLACPSNPHSRAVPGIPLADPPTPGSNGAGWEFEPGLRMPISYSMSSCSATWYPQNTPQGKSSPPLTQAQLKKLYKDKKDYQAKVQQRYDELMKQGWALQVYRSVVLGDAAKVNF